MNAAIQVENLTKRYQIGVQAAGYQTLREAITEAAASPFRRLGRWLRRTDDMSPAPDAILALQDISFEIQPGETVGIIGRNGAGKSTLLKILSGITEPSRGRIAYRGRVASLLEVGAGFHQELTGRENIYLNGAILGMTRQEVRKKFDDIVDFAEVSRFLDTPVKRYSSGMYVRLGFAVAAHLESEILLVDEVLAVGDLAFQKRVMGKMNEFGGQGRTVLFVSHNMAAVQGLCRRGLILDEGRLIHDQDIQAASQSYFQLIRSKSNGNGRASFRQTRASEDIQVLEAWITALGELHPEGFATGAPLTFHLRAVAHSPISNPVAFFQINRVGQGPLTRLQNEQAGFHFPRRVEGEFVLSCTPADLFLAPGEYTVTIGVFSGSRRICFLPDALCFSSVPTDFFGTGRIPERTQGCVLCRQKWDFATARQPEVMPSGKEEN